MTTAPGGGALDHSLSNPACSGQPGPREVAPRRTLNTCLCRLHRLPELSAYRSFCYGGRVGGGRTGRLSARPGGRVPELHGELVAAIRLRRRPGILIDHQLVDRHRAFGEQDDPDVKPTPGGHLQAHVVEQPADVRDGDGPVPSARGPIQLVSDSRPPSGSPPSPPVMPRSAAPAAACWMIGPVRPSPPGRLTRWDSWPWGWLGCGSRRAGRAGRCAAGAADAVHGDLLTVGVGRGGRPSQLTPLLRWVQVRLAAAPCYPGPGQEHHHYGCVAQQTRRIRPSPSVRGRWRSRRAGLRSRSGNQSRGRSGTGPGSGQSRSRRASRPGRTPAPSRCSIRPG